MGSRLDVVGQILTCTACELHAQCTAPVALRGPTPATVAVVGEAPGPAEDDAGLPFVGPAGELIVDLLARIGVTDPAWLNAVSCFPHGPPTADQVHACDANRRAQLELVQPVYVLLLGKVALKATRPELEIGPARGRPFLHDGRLHFAVYHPAAARRAGNYLRCLEQDLDQFARLLATPDWISLIPDTCAACPAYAEWWESSGLGWCPQHLPPAERILYSRHHAFLEQQRQRTASDQWRDQMANARAARDGVDATQFNADFDGSDYVRAYDHDRLGTQLGDVHAIMIDHQWRTIAEIQALCVTLFGRHHPDASVGKHLRHLRYDRFGAHRVDKRAVGDRERGLWEYRVNEPGSKYADRGWAGASLNGSTPDNQGEAV